MNDYTRGVIEALTWVRHLLKENSNNPKAIEKISSEVAGKLRLISNNIAADFPEKIKLAAAGH